MCHANNARDRQSADRGERRVHLRASPEIAEKLARGGMSLRREVLDDPRRTLFAAEDRPPRDGVTGEIRDVLDRLGEVIDRLERRPAA